MAESSISFCMETAKQNLSIDSWYPLLRKHSLNTKILTLDQEFIEYLQLDGVNLPPSLNKIQPAAPEDYDILDDEDWAGCYTPNTETRCPEFEHVQDFIRCTLEEFEGEIAPRGNWCSPVDALFMLPNGQLKCTSVEDVFLVIKGSDRICTDCAEAANPVLALRKWYSLDQGMEFRCFVCNGVLCGISQKHCGERYPHLSDLKQEARSCIEEFWTKEVRLTMNAIQTYTMDVYLQRRKSSGGYRVFVTSFGFWGAAHESDCLFEWDELAASVVELGGSTPSSNILPNLPFRVVEGDRPLAPGDSLYRGVPYDLRNSNAEDLVKVLQEQAEQERKNSSER